MDVSESQWERHKQVQGAAKCSGHFLVKQGVAVEKQWTVLIKLPGTEEKVHIQTQWDAGLFSNKDVVSENTSVEFIQASVGRILERHKRKSDRLIDWWDEMFRDWCM